MGEGNTIRDTLRFRIGQLRVEKNISQADLAKFMGVKREAISQWENGSRGIKAGDVARLAQFFGVTSDYLLGLTKAKTVDWDVQSVCTSTGLSDNAVKALISVNADQDSVSQHMIAFISDLITAPDGVWEAVSLNAARYAMLSRKTPLTSEEYEKMLVSLFACQELLKEFIKRLNWEEE